MCVKENGTNTKYYYKVLNVLKIQLLLLVLYDRKSILNIENWGSGSFEHGAAVARANLVSPDLPTVHRVEVYVLALGLLRWVH